MTDTGTLAHSGVVIDEFEMPQAFCSAAISEASNELARRLLSRCK